MESKCGEADVSLLTPPQTWADSCCQFRFSRLCTILNAQRLFCFVIAVGKIIQEVLIMPMHHLVVVDHVHHSQPQEESKQYPGRQSDQQQEPPYPGNFCSFESIAACREICSRN